MKTLIEIANHKIAKMQLEETIIKMRYIALWRFLLEGENE